MADEPPIQRGRRIHIEGAGQAWTGGRPVVPPGFQPASTPPPAVPPRSESAFSGTANAETLARNEATTRAQIGGLAHRVKALKERLADVAAREIDDAQRKVADVRGRTEQTAGERLAELSLRHFVDQEALVERLGAVADELAPGPAGAEWTSPDLNQSSPIARHLRIGSLPSGNARYPALLPFLGHAGWFVTGPRTQVDDLVVGTVARVVAQAPLKKLRLTVFDPRSRGVLGHFAPLRQAAGSTFPTPTSDSRAFSERISDVLETVSRDTEVVAGVTSGDLIDLWRTAPVPEGTLHVVVVLDYPFGIDEPLQQQLLRIAATESPVRPVLLVAADEHPGATRDVVPAELSRLLTMFAGAGNTWKVPGYPAGVDIAGDGAPPREVLAALIGRAAEQARSDTGPTIPLADLIGADLERPWTNDSTDSLDLVFGRAGRSNLELSLRTENPPHPNMLVGGMVGTGKSNLLLDIIYGLATRYAPDEFELHLLDFKQGLEFARFAPNDAGNNWLPHVRTLGLESDLAFGLAVLHWFLEELERRSERFKAAGQSGIVGYRRATGEKVPRLLLIIDEFHELFAGSDAEQELAVEGIERLAKQGRVYGVHLLLASQTITGVSALAVKGEGIFAQFPLRLSLKNTATESEAILSQGNKAAADLTYRGEVVFNINAGHAPDTSNQVGIAAYAESDAMARLQSTLWSLGHGTPPLVFLGREYATWPAAAPRASGRGVEIWLGRPIAISETPRIHHIAEDADQAVVILGQARAHAPGPRETLRTMILSALPSLRSGRVVVLDGDGADADSWFAEIEGHVRDQSIGFVRVDAHGAAQWLRSELKGRLADRHATAPILVVGLSVQRLRDLDLDLPDAGDDDDGYSSEDNSARVVLRDLAQRGAQNRVFFIGAWNNLRTMETDLGSYGSGVALYVTVDLGLEDLRLIAGPAARRIEASPRVGVFDRSAGDTFEVLVPYAPSGAPAEETQ